MPTKSKDPIEYVAFVDLMGFGAGQERLDEPDACKLASVMSGDWIVHPELSDEAKTQYVRYLTFHRHLSDATSANPALSLVATFSDSGFFASGDRSTIVDVSCEIIQRCYEENVPIRVGIGRGTIGRATFSVALNAERLAATSQLFGSGVVRAYRAHCCAAKGFRVFVHPSAELPTDADENWMFPALLKKESTRDARRELNFMYRGRHHNEHDWIYSLESSIQRMRRVGDDNNVLRHYDASTRAIGRFEKLLVKRFGNDGIIRVKLS